LEFRLLNQLRKRILGQHPNFSELKRIISQGMDYHQYTWPLPELVREQELAAVTKRGNLKSEVSQTIHMATALNKDVVQRFSMPILPESVPKIAGSMAQPLGMAK
jgi:hypothetical protein